MKIAGSERPAEGGASNDDNDPAQAGDADTALANTVLDYMEEKGVQWEAAFSAVARRNPDMVKSYGEQPFHELPDVRPTAGR